MEKIKVTEQECSEVMNCKCCTHKENGTHECCGCGTVCNSKAFELIEEDSYND